MNEIIAKLKLLIPTLPRVEKKIAEAILAEPEGFRDMTLAQLARETGSSDASIIRLCRRLDLDGYIQLKEAFFSEEHQEQLTVLDKITSGDSMNEILKKVFLGNVRALENTLLLASEEYEAALDALLRARSIHFFGAGDAAAVCQLAYLKFGRLGYISSCHTDPVKQLMQAGTLSRGDVAFAISYEGRSRNVVEAMRVAKEKGATTIVITKMNRSLLLKVTDIRLLIATDDLSVGRDIVTRRIADQMILDALYLGVMSRIGEEKQEQIREMRGIMDRNKIRKGELR